MTVVLQSQSFMEEAIELAKEAARQGEVPVGAVVVLEGEIISRAHNLVETLRDPTAHAEILALRQAAQILQATRLGDCDLYVTLEPCTMCASAIAHSRVKRLYYGAYDPKGGAVDHGVRFFSQPTCFHRPEVFGGIDEKECSSLLLNFFGDKR